jgi:electron transfer flavoprotein-quinone oxidoreductase
MEKFDVIIVGAGPAGATAAYLLARNGLNVAVIERGNSPGSKNVSGGLIYSRIYEEIFPQFWKSAPVERAITSHQVVMLARDSSVALDYRSQAASQPPYNAFSVLRAKFDPWLAQQAEEAGATVISGVTVDALIQNGPHVTGIKAGTDELGADVVVIAEGVRSTLLKQAGLRENYEPKDISLGIKEVIALPEETITERFQCDATTGAAYTLVGHTGGLEGGGFIYTNRASLSVGVVVKISSLAKSHRAPHEVLEEFKNHPLVARLVRGGEIVEYAAQTVHRGGFHLIPRLYGDGYVVVGSAARLLLNNMFTLRGMDVAVASAAAAAKAILEANSGRGQDPNRFALYMQYFKESSVYRDMETFQHTYPLLENPRLFGLYPDLVSEIMEGMFGVSDRPAKKLSGAILHSLRGKASVWTVVKDLLQIGRGLV